MSRLDVKRIKARCEEDGDCLIWTGKIHKKNGSPQGTEWVDGKDRYVGVRRRAYEEYHGVTLCPKDLIATCVNPRCLAKAHLERITPSERNRRMHQTLDAASRIKRSKALSSVMRAQRGKVTPVQVRAVLESQDGPYVTAKRLGINGVVASRIKRGISYRNYAQTPFTGLMR